MDRIATQEFSLKFQENDFIGDASRIIQGGDGNGHKVSSAVYSDQN